MDATPRCAVITGASAGVGRATALEFARRGIPVGLVARGEAGLRSAVTEIEGIGGRAVAVRADVARFDALEAAAVRVEAELGPIGTWINNAMVTIFAPLRRIRPEEFRRVTEVTYLGTVHGTMIALDRMGPRGGTIVQVGSALAYRSIPLQSAYCGAKFAIRGFTDSVRSELLHDGLPVDLTMVQLPAINTPQFGWCRDRMPRSPRPMGPVFQPEVAARAIRWAAQHRPRELFVGHRSRFTVWAEWVVPRELDRYLARHGYAAQMTDRARPEGAPDNLFEPVATAPGAHGAFDREARTRLGVLG